MTDVSRKGARMRVLVMGSSPFLVRGLAAELGDRGVVVAQTLRTVTELSVALTRTSVDALLACLSGPPADARASALAITSVLSERPSVALLALTAQARSSRLWPAANPSWETVPLERVDADGILAHLHRVTGRHPPSRVGRADPTLTAGEQRVLDLLAVGLSNEAIAHHLSVSPKTVETHVSRAFSKLGLVNDDHSRNRRVLAALRWAGV